VTFHLNDIIILFRSIFAQAPIRKRQNPFVSNRFVRRQLNDIQAVVTERLLRTSGKRRGSRIFERIIMNNYKYIFWDLDGTLIDTYEGISRCINHALEPNGINLDTREKMLPFIGPPLRSSFQKILGMTASDAEEAVARFREEYNETGLFECKPYPEIKSTLANLGQVGFIQVVASSKPEETCKRILDKFGMSNYFHEIVGATPDGEIESKTEVINEACRRLQEKNPEFKKSQVLLIGDTTHDALGAVMSGVQFMGVLYGYGKFWDLVEWGAMYAFATLEELVQVLSAQAAISDRIEKRNKEEEEAKKAAEAKRIEEAQKAAAEAQDPTSRKDVKDLIEDALKNSPN